jgi:hypothetical protein
VSAIRSFYKDRGQLLRTAFKKSVWPACTWNFPDQAITPVHRDVGNPPSIPCSITPGGDFNPDKGGFIVLYDLKLIIRFPAGSNISFCSGGVAHGNLPIQAGELRSSFIQYMAGGLARHISYGFKPERLLKDAVIADLASRAPQRYEEALRFFSTVDSLAQDRGLVLPLPHSRT